MERDPGTHVVQVLKVRDQFEHTNGVGLRFFKFVDERLLGARMADGSRGLPPPADAQGEGENHRRHPGEHQRITAPEIEFDGETVDFLAAFDLGKGGCLFHDVVRCGIATALPPLP